MGFCSQCGRPVGDHASFCPSCGAAHTPSSGAAHAAAPAPGARGPVGEVRPPGIVLLLIVVTLGIYSLIYWLRAARETDDYTGRPGHAHGKVKTGLLLYAGAIGVMILAFILFSGSLPAAESTQGPNVADPALGGFFLMIMAAIAAILAGVVLLFMGQWRVWSAIREDEQRRLVPNPLSPGLMLAFMLIPYVNLVTLWIAYYTTQKRLNGMWTAAAAPSYAAPPRLL